MKSSAITIAILLAMLLFLQGCGLPESSVKECYTDSDCVKTQITCCECAVGGTDMCVSRTLAPLYEEKLKSCPPENEKLCMAVNNCKVNSCVCSKGTCKQP